MITEFRLESDYRKWQLGNISYSNRQVKGTENLFGPDDIDANLTGGQNLPNPEGSLKVVINNSGAAITEISPEDFSDDFEEWEDDESREVDEDPEVYNPSETPKTLDSVTKVTFTQKSKFTPNGTFLADVEATIEDVTGAITYEVTYFKIS